MKIKCAVCGLVVDKTKEEIQKLKTYSKTGKVLPDKILKLLDIFEGPCGEESEHCLSWDLEFLKQVEDVKRRHNYLLKKKENDSLSLDTKMKEIEELKKKLEDADKMGKSLIIQLAKIDEEIPNVENLFEDITGTRDLGEWK